MKRLIIGSVPDNFNFKNDIVVGSYCFLKKEHLLNELDSINFLDDTFDLKKILDYDIKCSIDAYNLVSEIAKKYNQLTFENYSLEFWRTIYFPFLGLYVPWFHRKICLVNKIINQFKDEEIEVTLAQIGQFDIIKDLSSFEKNIVKNPNVNHWIISEILRDKIPKNWKVNETKLVHENILEKKEKLNVFSSFKKIINSIFYRMESGYGISFIHSIFFHLLLTFKPKSKSYNTVSNLNNQVEIKIDNQSLLYNYIDKLMPVNIKKIKVLQSHFKKAKKNKVIYFSNKLYSDINSKIIAALCKENDGIILAGQHGGHTYGSALTSEYKNIIELNNNLFISWGDYKNNSSKSDNLICLPSPLLSKYKNKYIKKNEKIILVGTNMNLLQHRYDCIPSQSNWLNYRENKSVFIQHIINPNFYYRPYPQQSSSLLDLDFVKLKIPNLKVLDGDIFNEIMSCKLLVLDHPGTTWNIAMAMNTPVVCFWKRNHFPFNKIANDYLIKLEKAGLFFDNPIDASKKITEITNEYNSVVDWWSQESIQNLRDEWSNLYAKSDSKWFRKWSQALWNL